MIADLDTTVLAHVIAFCDAVVHEMMPRRGVCEATRCITWRSSQARRSVGARKGAAAATAARLGRPRRGSDGDDAPPSLWSSINAVTLMTSDMGGSTTFYEALGLFVTWRSANFTTLSSRNVSASHAVMHVNLQLNTTFAPAHGAHGLGWGRFIAYVTDVDEVYRLAKRRGSRPKPRQKTRPGRAIFQIRDPMGHEMAIARPL